MVFVLAGIELSLDLLVYQWWLKTNTVFMILESVYLLKILKCYFGFVIKGLPKKGGTENKAEWI